MRPLALGAPIGDSDEGFKNWVREAFRQIELASNEHSGEGEEATAAAAGTAVPLMDGVAAVGTSVKWAHEDHVHPSEGGTAVPLMDGVAAVGTSAKWAHEDHVHPTDTSLNAAIAAAIAAATTPECGKFVYVSATQCKLIPFYGDKIKIGGALYDIPAAGVTVSNSGLSNSTLYYCYAYITGGSLALEFSATGHSMDTTVGNVGVEIKSGVPSRSLVGMVFTTAAGQFNDINSDRRVRSWFNDWGHRAFTNDSATINVTSVGSWTELSPSVRATILCWSGEQLVLTAATEVANTSVGQYSYFSCYLVSSSTGSPNPGPLGLLTFSTAKIAGYFDPITHTTSVGLTGDGLYTLGYAGQVTAGTATYHYRTLNAVTTRK